MERRVALALACALIVAALPAGASGTGAADRFVGTWGVFVDAVRGAPFDTGSHKVTITTTSQAVALPEMEAAAPYRDGSMLFCGATPQKPKDHPGATWYRLAYTWSGGGVLYSCVTVASGGTLFVADAHTLYLTPFPDALRGTWQGTWGNHATEFPITLKKSAGGGTGGGGTTPVGAQKTVTEPEPGESLVVSSPRPLPADCSRTTSSARAASACNPLVTISSSGVNTLSGTTVVGEGEQTSATTAGEAVASCWLAGPDSLAITSTKLKEKLVKLKGEIDRYGPDEQLRFCIALVQTLAVFGERKPSSAAAPCRVQRLSMTYRQGHVATARTTAPSGKVRYGCSISGGTMKLTLSGDLRTIGPKLDLGVVRAKNAPKRSAKLRFAYSW